MRKINLLYILILLFSLTFLFGCQNISEDLDSTNIKLTCVTSWSCGNWSNCTNGFQTRICNDESGCKNQSDAPKMNQSCSSQSQVQTQTFVSSSNIKFAKTGQNYLEKDDIVSYKNKVIKLDRISDNAVLLNITGEIVTLKIDQQKAIDGVKLNLIATFDTAATIEFS